MGDDTINSMVYAINKETGEEFAIGGIVEIPKLAPGGIVDCESPIGTLAEDTEGEITVRLKTIKKKRFIKLLMAKGYQRNEAIKIHKEYMNEHRLIRSRLGLELFVITYNTEPNEVKVFVEGKETNVNGKTNNM